MPLLRVQKIIAQAGLASRREAEEWIRQRRVLVNGKVASLGDRADPEEDSVRVDGKRVPRSREERTYLLLHKPKGYITTSDPAARDTVLDLLPEGLRRRLKPVGRLDVETEGLLLLTDDGDLAHRVAHPSSGCPKEYRVKVSGNPEERSLDRLRRGLDLDRYRTRPCQIERISPATSSGGGNAWLRVILLEGRSRQIRRMFESIGHPVSRLKRVAIGPVRDADLRPGAYRRLTAQEVAALKKIGRQATEEGRRKEKS